MPGDVTVDQWARALLQKMGIPASPQAVYSLRQWAAAEGGHWNNSAKYNPLNTSMNMPGAKAMNSHGVKIYNSWEQGLDATARTLRLSSYDGIVKALRDGDFEAFRAAVAASPWGTTNIPAGDGKMPAGGFLDINPFDNLGPGQQDSPGDFDAGSPLDALTRPLTDLVAAVGVIATTLSTLVAKLGDREFWINAGKIALGLWLLGMGLRRLFYIAT